MEWIGLGDGSGLQVTKRALCHFIVPRATLTIAEAVSVPLLARWAIGRS